MNFVMVFLVLGDNLLSALPCIIQSMELIESSLNLCFSCLYC
jgi:hypothetical protein